MNERLPVRLKLFGITGAATLGPAPREAQKAPASNSLESRVLRPVCVSVFILFVSVRLKLFGITGAATIIMASLDDLGVPPQTLWNHGCCDPIVRFSVAAPSSRLKLFGITGAATGKRPSKRIVEQAASNSLESRVLRHKTPETDQLEETPPQTLWNHGCCDSHNVWIVADCNQPPQTLWNHGCCDSGCSQRL